MLARNAVPPVWEASKLGGPRDERDGRLVASGGESLDCGILKLLLQEPRDLLMAAP